MPPRSHSPIRMSFAHLLLALAVIIVWGTNFVIIKLGLGELPPLLFATLRFVFSCMPWLIFVRRPAVPWRLLIANGYEYLLSGKYWISFYPGVALLLTILSINLVGDRLRDQWNPRLAR